MRDALPSLLFGDPRLSWTQMRGGVESAKYLRQANVSGIVDEARFGSIQTCT